jgi:DNA-nicking Smr family endonuclease
MSGSRRRPLTDDERVLWSEFTRKIAPLDKRRRVETAPAQGETAAPQPLKRSKAPPVAPKMPAPETKKDPAPLTPMARREKQRIARGKAEIDGRFDLHGMTQAQAHGALSRFLHSARSRDARLVLVITGKSGVLRRQVPQWLALPEFRELIVSVEPAAIQHGGEGALYVRVRRVRE